MTKHTSIAVNKLTADQLSLMERRLGPIEYRTIGSVTAYVKNPRRHPEGQLVKLMTSISQFGFALPVLVDDEGVIIVGHARTEAARRLCMTEIPVLVAAEWSKAQVRAYRLADNRLAEIASWDDELLAVELSALVEIDEGPIEVLGWETGEIDLIIGGETNDLATADPADTIAKLPAVPVTRTGDLWKLGGHRLLCGSSLEPNAWERLMQGQLGAMAFMDPASHVRPSEDVCGLRKVRHAELAMASGGMSKAEFRSVLATAIGQLSGNLRDGAVLDVCIDWRHLSDLFSAIESNSLRLLDLCVWAKTNANIGSLYHSQHELILVAKKGSAAHINNVELGKHGRYRTNLWTYPGAKGFGKNPMADLADHPSVKPVALVADAIRDVTRRGDIVIDAFTGSGTTILAAERAKRNAYGVELDPGYVDVAIRRWSAMTGAEAVLVETGETFTKLAAQHAGDNVGRDLGQAVDKG